MALGVPLQNPVGREEVHTVQFEGQADHARGHHTPRSRTSYGNTVSMCIEAQGSLAPLMSRCLGSTPAIRNCLTTLFPLPKAGEG